MADDPDRPGRDRADGLDGEPAHDTAAATVAAAYAAGRFAVGHRWVFYLLGGISLLTGLLAIVLPLIGSLAAVLAVGVSLLVSGVLGGIAAFRARGGGQIASAIALALLSLVAGVLMLAQPLLGVFALTTVFIAWLLVGGSWRLWAGLTGTGRRGAGWMIASGVLAIALAVLLWAGLPDNAAWVPGLVFGIDLLVWGALLLALAAEVEPAREAAQAGRDPR